MFAGAIVMALDKPGNPEPDPGDGEVLYVIDENRVLVEWPDGQVVIEDTRYLEVIV